MPLVEAMWYDTPVIAYASSAVAETMGETGVLLEEKRDLQDVAAIVFKVLTDREVRNRVLESQRRRRDWNKSSKVTDQLHGILEKLRGVSSEA